ncbi:MAG: hypothetical protein AAFR61_27690 [Bacteroidota bacterium]
MQSIPRCFLALCVLIYSSLDLALVAQESTDMGLDQTFPSGTSVIADDFPIVSVLVPFTNGMFPDSKFWEVKENDEFVPIQEVNPGLPHHALNLGLVVEHSTQLLGEESAENLADIQHASGAFLQSLRVNQDSILLVSFGATVDHQTELTDLSYNMPVLEIILNGLQAEEGVAFYDALQQGLEGLVPHGGQKAIVGIISGEDDRSETPFRTLAGSAKVLKIPFYLFVISDQTYPKLEDLAHQSGGSLTYLEEGSQLEPYLLALSKHLQNVYEIRYLSSDEPDRARKLDIAYQKNPDARLNWTAHYKFSGQGEGTPALAASEESGGNLRLPPKSWINIAIVVLMASLVLGLFLRRLRRQGHVSNQIVPAITEVDEKIRRGKVKIQMNVPQPRHPARVTVTTMNGRPVKDYILSGRKRKAKLDVSDLPDGIYFLTLANKGLNSEPVEMVIST